MGGQTDSQIGSQVHASRKKVINFTHIQLTCDQLVSTCVGWRNAEKLASTCVRIWARLKSSQVVTSQGKWVAKRNASWTQVENLRWLASWVRLARVSVIIFRAIFMSFLWSVCNLLVWYIQRQLFCHVVWFGRPNLASALYWICDSFRRTLTLAHCINNIDLKSRKYM